MGVQLGNFINLNLQETGGSSEMAVDGDPTEVVFGVPVEAGFNFELFAIIFNLVDDGPCRADRFGGGAALTNGVVVEIIPPPPNNEAREFLLAKTNGDFGILGEFNLTGFERGWNCIFDIRKLTGGEPITLPPTSIVQVRIQDDITEISSFTAVIYGILDSTSINLGIG